MSLLNEAALCQVERESTDSCGHDDVPVARAVRGVASREHQALESLPSEQHPGGVRQDDVHRIDSIAKRSPPGRQQDHIPVAE